MKCPNCGNEISDSLLVCPLCKNVINSNKFNQQVVRINTNAVPTKVIITKKNNDLEVIDDKKNFLFFKITIVVGLLIFSVLLIRLFLINDTKDINNDVTTTITTNKVVSSNIGVRSTYSFPISLGNTTLATLYDEEHGKYTDVDVLGIRYIVNDELNDLVYNYASTENLIDGFYWYGFEYNVKLNDLSYLNNDSISPILETSIYQLNGNDFFLVGDHYYKIKVTSIYNGVDIKNKESASVKVIFQVPCGYDFSICVGLRNKTMGCFLKG